MANDQDNRVLSRIGARLLSDEEAEEVPGGLGTKTKCSGPSPTNPKGDGDPGECNW